MARLSRHAQRVPYTTGQWSLNAAEVRTAQ